LREPVLHLGGMWLQGLLDRLRCRLVKDAHHRDLVEFFHVPSFGEPRALANALIPHNSRELAANLLVFLLQRWVGKAG
jgi:hypothetical protein